MLITIRSNSLGDNIAAIPVIEKYQAENQKDVYVKIKPEYLFLFEKSYPTLKFISSKNNSTFTQEIELEYDFNENIQYGYANN